MQILQVRVMRGPNYWSVNQNKLIVVRVSVKKSDLITNDHISEYNKMLSKHKLSFEPIHGTSLCQLTRKVAIALQGLNDTNGNYFGTRIGIGKDESYVVFPYAIEAAGTYAAEAAVKFMN